MSEARSHPALLDIRERIRAASADQTPLYIAGGRTKTFYGEDCPGGALNLGAYEGVISYEPTELMVNVRAGTPVADLEHVLAEHNQWLACEPLCFGPGGTVGGMVAAGLSGPGRAMLGGVRDFMLGACMVDAHGEWLSFGGQVMKNVAGYDVSRLLCGSLGILGPILEVSLKVLPKPAFQESLSFEADQATAIRVFNELAGRPLPITATAWFDGRASVRLAGARPAVQAAATQLREQHGAQAQDDALWQQLREHDHPMLASPAEDLRLWRLSVPASVAPLPLPGECLIEWGGAQRWLLSDAPEAAVRAAARAAGGSATRFRGSGDEPIFEPLPEVLLRVHQRLKNEFDPLALFNRGRLIPSL